MLKGKGAAKASGFGTVTGPAALKGSGAAKPSGFGTLHRRAELVGSSTAEAEGYGFISIELAIDGEGTAGAGGVGWLSWKAPPAVPSALEDAWFYGHSSRREMPGTGTALARGSGALTV